MSIKKQLAAYYDAQGLEGKHRRKAVQYDRKQLRKAKPFSSEDSVMSYPWQRMSTPPYYWVLRFMGSGR